MYVTGIVGACVTTSFNQFPLVGGISNYISVRLLLWVSQVVQKFNQILLVGHPRIISRMEETEGINGLRNQSTWLPLNECRHVATKQFK